MGPINQFQKSHFPLKYFLYAYKGTYFYSPKPMHQAKGKIKCTEHFAGYRS